MKKENLISTWISLSAAYVAEVSQFKDDKLKAALIAILMIGSLLLFFATIKRGTDK